MAQKKANEVDSWLRRPDPGIAIVLLYGPDRGLVSERAQAFVKVSGVDVDDPFSTVRLDAGEIDGAPGRLVEEATTVPMFSARRLVWIRGAGAQKQLADDLKVLAAEPPRDATILIEAGDLKKSATLRSTVEGAACAMALPCYSDEARSVDAVIDELLARDGLTIAIDARQLLRSNLGGDRLATRSELEKLMLYSYGNREIHLEDVEAAIGDVSGLSMDEAIDAVLLGASSVFDTAFGRLVASGTNPFLLLAAAMRQYQALQALREQMDQGGKSAAAAVAAARPPIFFTRRKTVETALQRLDAGAIARALERLHAAVLQTRRRADLAEATARQALIALLVEAARAGAGRSR
jgi:DNA polymerase-3 subunit delta